MNLLNGVFSTSSAFSQVKNEGKFRSHERQSRSMKTNPNSHSSSSSSSLNERKTIVTSSERCSSSSERDVSLTSDKGGSLERETYHSSSPLISDSRSFFKPKAMKPVAPTNFNFLSKCNINGMNGLGISNSFYWMKYQMIMKQRPQVSKISSLSMPSSVAQNISHSEIFNSDQEIETREKMIGQLTESERKKKVERYLEKKRRKSKAVRYE